MEDVEGQEKMRAACWDSALYCFGHAYIFEKRAKRYSNWQKLLNFLSIATPLTVGGISITYGANFSGIDYFIVASASLSTPLLILSLWSIIFEWNRLQNYSFESKSANRSLYERFRSLAANPPDNYKELAVLYQRLEIEYKCRQDLDDQQSITDKENRMGMRAGLRQLQRKCVQCGQIPATMKASKCGVCGNPKGDVK